jgi:hypothetical protein
MDAPEHIPSEASTPTDDYLAESEQYRIGQEREYIVCKESVFSQLTQRGVAKAFISFNGHGDDGQIEYIKVRLVVERNSEELSQSDKALYDAIEELAYRHLNLKRSGWELDAGSIGKIVLDEHRGEIREEFMKRLGYEDDEDLENFEDLD